MRYSYKTKRNLHPVAQLQKDKGENDICALIINRNAIKSKECISSAWNTQNFEDCFTSQSKSNL